MKTENKKIIISLSLAGIMALSNGFVVDKNDSNRNLFIKPIAVNALEDLYLDVQVNSKHLDFDTKPTIKNDRVFVPMRKIFEELNANVQYDEKTNSINVTTLEKDKLIHQIGTNKIIKNGNESLEFDVESYVDKGRTMVPVRFVAESLGAEVAFRTDYAGKKFVEVIKVVKEANGNTNITNEIIGYINSNPNITKIEKDTIINNLTPMFNDLSKYINLNVAKNLKTLKIEYDQHKDLGNYSPVENLIVIGFPTFTQEIKGILLHEVIHAMQGRADYGIKEGMVEFILGEYLKNHTQSYRDDRLITLICMEAFGKELVARNSFNNYELFDNKEYSDIIPKNFDFCNFYYQIYHNNNSTASYSTIIYDEQISKDYKLKAAKICEEFIDLMTKVYEKRTGKKASDNKLLMLYFDGLDFKNRLNIPSEDGDLSPLIDKTNYKYFNNHSNDEEDIKVSIDFPIPLGNEKYDIGTYEYNIGPKYSNNKTLKLTK